MTEHIYTDLWRFAVAHADDAAHSGNSLATEIFKMYQDTEDGRALRVLSADDTEEIYRCINDALNFGHDEIFNNTHLTNA